MIITLVVMTRKQALLYVANHRPSLIKSLSTIIAMVDLCVRSYARVGLHVCDQRRIRSLLGLYPERYLLNMVESLHVTSIDTASFLLASKNQLRGNF